MGCLARVTKTFYLQSVDWHLKSCGTNIDGNFGWKFTHPMHPRRVRRRTFPWDRRTLVIIVTAECSQTFVVFARTKFY